MMNEMMIEMMIEMMNEMLNEMMIEMMNEMTARLLEIDLFILNINSSKMLKFVELLLRYKIFLAFNLALVKTAIFVNHSPDNSFQSQ